MSNIVSITSQGQISIPAKLRREIGLDKKKKAVVHREGNRLVIEPVMDLLSLKGSLKHKARKGMSIKQVLKEEKMAWEKAAVERYLRTTGK